MSTLLKWQNLGRLASVMLLALFLGCIGGGRRHDPQGSLEVVNASDSANLNQLFVTPSSSPTWGPDQLPPTPPLSPGGSLTLDRLFPDLYDVQAVFSDGSSDLVFDVPIEDGVVLVLPMASTGTGTVTVINDGNFQRNVTGVFLTLSSSPTFGPNQLDGPLFPAPAIPNTLVLTGITPSPRPIDTYDLRVVFSDSSFTDILGFTVVSGGTNTFRVN